MLIAILHAIGDDDDPYQIVAKLLDAVPPGSYLALSHVASDIDPDQIADATARLNQLSHQRFTLRDHVQVLRFFDGLEVLEPGVVRVEEWRAPELETRYRSAMWGGVGRKSLGRIAPFAGLSPRALGKLITILRHEGADSRRPGRPWSLPLEDRVLLVVAYWRTNLTLWQLAPLSGVSKSAADRIVHHVGSLLALKQRQGFPTNTVLIADGTLVHTRPQHRRAVEELSLLHQPPKSSSTRYVPNRRHRPASAPVTATIAGPGPSPGPRQPSAQRRQSPTAATRALA
jgi:hypothetical protein